MPGERAPGLAALLLLSVVLLLLRVPYLFSRHYVLDGDEAILGLMAWHAAQGLELPVFFWGQSYGFSHLEVLPAALADAETPPKALLQLCLDLVNTAHRGNTRVADEKFGERKLSFDPVFAVVYPIPSVLFLPLVSFVVPAGEIALVVTSAVTSFFLIALTTTHGVRQIDRLVVEAALHYGARGRRLFTAVLLPGALPSIFTGLRLGLGFSLIVVIAVEIVSASRGLGALLWLSWQVLKVEDMYATFVVIALLGALLSYGLAALRSRLLPWVPDVGDR